MPTSLDAALPQEPTPASATATDSEDAPSLTTVVTVQAPKRAKRGRSGRLLDLNEAEAYSGISAWTLRELIASGDLPAVRPPHLRRVWIDRADLDKAIAEWKDRTG